MNDFRGIDIMQWYLSHILKAHASHIHCLVKACYGPLSCLLSAFCSVCAEIVSVTLNNNNGVDDLFLIYCSFSHLIEPAMYRLEYYACDASSSQ